MRRRKSAERDPLRSILGQLNLLKRGLEKETQGRNSRQGAISPSKNSARRKIGPVCRMQECEGPAFDDPVWFL